MEKPYSKESTDELLVDGIKPPSQRYDYLKKLNPQILNFTDIDLIKEELENLTNDILKFSGELSLVELGSWLVKKDLLLESR